VFRQRICALVSATLSPEEPPSDTITEMIEFFVHAELAETRRALRRRH
jgi:hypothetical protein